jgi:hypothetical protein
MLKFKRYVCVGLVAQLCVSCAANRVVSQHIEQDSVSVEVRERIEYIRDTVEVAIPAISESVATRDTVSHLENPYASSRAVIAGGVLHHSLMTKPQIQRIPVRTPSLRRDSIVYRNFYRDITTSVERELTWWQETQIKGFWLMLSIFGSIILYKLLRAKLGGWIGSISRLFK